MLRVLMAHVCKASVYLPAFFINRCVRLSYMAPSFIDSSVFYGKNHFSLRPTSGF